MRAAQPEEQKLQDKKGTEEEPCPAIAGKFHAVIR
jgi:hypothetical protein